jgi:hypothetical protein
MVSVHACSGHRMIESPWICRNLCTQTHRRLEVEPHSPLSRPRPRHCWNTRAPGSRRLDDAARKSVKITLLPPRGAPAQRGLHAEMLQRRRSTRSGSGAAKVPTAAYKSSRRGIHTPPAEFVTVPGGHVGGKTYIYFGAE